VLNSFYIFNLTFYIHVQFLFILYYLLFAGIYFVVMCFVYHMLVCVASGLALHKDVYFPRC